MTQVVYGQKGYLGSSMSVRAAEAYEQGEMPISRWTKTAIIHAVKDYCFDFDLAYDPDIEKKTKAELANIVFSCNYHVPEAEEKGRPGPREDPRCQNRCPSQGHDHARGREPSPVHGEPERQGHGAKPSSGESRVGCLVR